MSTENCLPISSAEQAAGYMERKLWEFIDMAAAFPEARLDPRTWQHVMAYVPFAKEVAREDAKQLHYQAASLTYADTQAEAAAKHRLHEIAMRLETGYYWKQGLTC